jgi:hypothetical protein
VDTAACSQPVDGGFEAIDAQQIAEAVEGNFSTVFGSCVVDCTDQRCPPLAPNSHVVLCGKQLYISSFLGGDVFEAASAEDGHNVLLYRWAPSVSVSAGCVEATRAFLGHRIIAPSREVYGVAFADGGVTVIGTECRALPLGTVLMFPSARAAATKAFLMALTALVSRRVTHTNLSPQNVFLCEDGTVVASHWEAAADFTMFSDGLAGCTKLLSMETHGGERRLRGFDADIISVHPWLALGLPRCSAGAWAAVGEQLRNRPTRWADYIMSLRAVLSSMPATDVATLHEAFASASPGME